MPATHNSITKWIIILTALLALMEIGVSLYLFLMPESMADQMDLQAKGAGYLIGMWSTRQFALGVMLAFAAFKRSAPMLMAAYIFVLVMFIGDLVVGIKEQDNMLMASALVMSALAGLVLYELYRKRVLI